MLRPSKHLFAFGWAVAACGYRWADRSIADKEREPHDDKVLVVSSDRYGDSGGAEMVQTSPLESDPALYRRFAALDPGDREAVRAFADANGLLVTRDEIDGRYRHTLADGRAEGPDIETMKASIKGATYEQVAEVFGREVRGETEAFWRTEIREMARAVDLWDKAAAGDRSSLSPSFLRMSYDEGYSWLENRVDRPEDHMPHPASARVWVYSPLGPTNPPVIVNGCFIEDAGAAVVGCEAGDAPTDAAKRLVLAVVAGRVSMCTPRIVEAPGGGYRFEISPPTLLEAMWVQFARSITGNKDHRACSVCGEWFEVSAGEQGGGTRKMFCGPTCKVRDSRRRKATTEELHALGKSPRQIAEATGTHIDTVKKWVGKRKG